MKPISTKPSVQLLLAALAALLLASCAASQPKAPTGVQNVRVRIVNQGHTHNEAADVTGSRVSPETIRSAIQRGFQQSLNNAGLRVVTNCEDAQCAELEARITSESWTEKNEWDDQGEAGQAGSGQMGSGQTGSGQTGSGTTTSDWINAQATVTLVNVSSGEIVGQGSGQGVISQSGRVHPMGTDHIANTALGEAFKSPRLARTSFDGKAPAPGGDNPPAEDAPATGADSDSSDSDGADGTFTHVAQPQPSAYALVIGVEDYRDLPATVGSRADATAFVDLLQTSLGVPEENIRTLLDDRATKSDLESAIRWVKNNVPKKGRIYLYFSGHGAPDPTTGKAYLLPYEAKSNDIAHGGLAIDKVLGDLGDSQAGEVLAFVDSCFSGEGERSVLEEGIRPVVPIKEPDATDKTVLFSASGAKEISGTTADGKGGLFTHHLLAAIGKGEADIDGDSSISLGELSRYVEPRVAREAKKLSREQNPTLTVGDALTSADDLLLVWGLSAGGK